MIPVIAYFFSESDEKLILEYLTNTERTESFFYGIVDRTNISKLRNAGILIDLPVKPGAAPAIPHGVKAGSARSVVPPAADRPAVPDRMLIRIAGPLLPSWKTSLEDKGMRIIEKFPDDVYEIATAEGAFPEFPFILSARPLKVADDQVKTRSVFGDFFESEPDRAAILDLRTTTGQVDGLLELVDSLGAEILGKSGNKIRIRVGHPGLIEQIQNAFPSDLQIEEYVRPVLHNDLARTILHIDVDSEAGTVPGAPYEGEGQIIGIADTGFDETHPDFHGRIYAIRALGREGDASDPNGHGTHVAGSVLGSGEASEGQIRGIAPQARLFFQSLLDAEGGLGGLPLNLSDLFREAYDEGVRVHNNSWGAIAESEYLFNSLEVDEFVHQHKDMLIVISAGNEGSAFMPRNSRRGYVDWLSISSPATAKNALTVGASRSNRAAGGFSGLTYGQAWPDHFPDDPLKQERISGDAESLAAFSSRGPCGNESRIKPDVVAPGTDIASAKSALAPAGNFWGPYPRNRHYAFMGGTSMAAPVVTGFAALIREYLVKERKHDPSAALLKAFIVNSTRPLSGPDAVADHAVIPNFHQGFGCVDLLGAIPTKHVPDFRVTFADTWQNPALQFRMTGQRFWFRVEARGSLPLKFCLTWTDHPGRGLQNNLNLAVLYKPQDLKWLGNTGLPRAITPLDRDNNVEVIKIESPHEGEYFIAVQAANVIFAPQDFALVVSGALISEIQPYQP